MAAELHSIKGKKSSTLELKEIFEKQREAFRRNPMPGQEQRRENLRRLKKMLLKNRASLCESIDSDFGGRSCDETLLAEFLPSVLGINHALKHLKGWMKPSPRRVHMLFMPARNKVYFQPLGVVGIIVPWNYPLYLAVGPLTSALAAGNRVMIKMSELAPRTADFFRKIIAETFSEDLVAVLTGDAEVAEEFSKLPFDHLLFTGSTEVGRRVMKAAAENLTPVTLELGGKSPAIISAAVPMKDAADRICFGKTINAGQTCVAPDYVLCPRDRMESFVEEFRRRFSAGYPTIKNNRDFTAIINPGHYKRLQDYLRDAKGKGGRIIELNPAEEELENSSRKMPIFLILNATSDMKVMQEEIFGPILPVIPYDELREALNFVNQRPRPLSLYYFGYDGEGQEMVLNHTHSGGVCINDTLTHVLQDEMPFGGVGSSGMGRYHGLDGFRTFSHPKGVYIKQRLNSARLIYPPYGKAIQKMIYRIFIR